MSCDFLIFLSFMKHLKIECDKTLELIAIWLWYNIWRQFYYVTQVILPAF